MRLVAKLPRSQAAGNFFADPVPLAAPFTRFVSPLLVSVVIGLGYAKHRSRGPAGARAAGNWRTVGFGFSFSRLSLDAALGVKGRFEARSFSEPSPGLGGANGSTFLKSANRLKPGASSEPALLGSDPLGTPRLIPMLPTSKRSSHLRRLSPGSAR